MCVNTNLIGRTSPDVVAVPVLFQGNADAKNEQAKYCEPDWGRQEKARPGHVKGTRERWVINILIMYLLRLLLIIAFLDHIDGVIDVSLGVLNDFVH